jgi:hypothetical protein
MRRRPKPASAISAELDVQSFPGRAQIEAALLALPENESGAPCAGLPRQLYIKGAVDELCIRGLLLQRAGGDGKAPPHYRPASAKTVASELEELKNRAERFARKVVNHGRDTLARKQFALLLRGLHADTIEAMDDAPLFMINGAPRLAVFSDVLRGGLPDRLEQGFALAELDMRLIAVLAERARTKVGKRNYPLKKGIGRYADRQANIILGLLAATYFDLTGREPGYTVPTDTTKTYNLRLVGKVFGGDWGALIKKIFEALNIERSVNHAVRRGKRGLSARN